MKKEMLVFLMFFGTTGLIWKFLHWKKIIIMDYS